MTDTDAKPMRKSSQLKISVGLGLLLLLVTLGLSRTAAWNVLAGETTTGTIEQISSVTQQNRSQNGHHESKHNTGKVSWQVDGRRYWTDVNLHLLLELKLLKRGDTVTIACDPKRPAGGLPLDWALFSPAVLILGLFSALILGICTPQLIWALASERRAEDAPGATKTAETGPT